MHCISLLVMAQRIVVKDLLKVTSASTYITVHPIFTVYHMKYEKD